MIHPSKTCCHCKQVKNINEFGIERRRKDGHRSICLKCRKIYRKKIYNSFLARKKAIKHLYNLSLEDYEKLLEKQNYSCAICLTENSVSGKRKFFHVDHDHETGKIRGLLCNRCNSAIGYFNENVAILNNAINYLRGFA